MFKSQIPTETSQSVSFVLWMSMLAMVDWAIPVTIYHPLWNSSQCNLPHRELDNQTQSPFKIYTPFVVNYHHAFHTGMLILHGIAQWLTSKSCPITMWYDVLNIPYIKTSSWDIYVYSEGIGNPWDMPMSDTNHALCISILWHKLLVGFDSYLQVVLL